MFKFSSFFWLILLFHFMNTSYSQTISIDKNSKHFKNAKQVFSNNPIDVRDTRKFSVIKVNEESIVFKLENSNGPTGDENQLQLDRSLNLNHQSFRLWSDLVTEHVTAKKFIEHSTLILNKNPFENGMDGLKGYIELGVRLETSYKYKLPKTKGYDYFTYALNFEYEKDDSLGTK